jgi:hypothetical protein
MCMHLTAELQLREKELGTKISKFPALPGAAICSQRLAEPPGPGAWPVHLCGLA